MSDNARTVARFLLASIRLINGSIGLFAPQIIARQLGVEPSSAPAAHYVLRMFGLRTVLIALDLLRPPGPARDQAIRVAPLIHASDTIAATLAARSGRLPTRAAISIPLISMINTGLALLIQTPETRARARRSVDYLREL